LQSFPVNLNLATSYRDSSLTSNWNVFGNRSIGILQSSHYCNDLIKWVIDKGPNEICRRKRFAPNNLERRPGRTRFPFMPKHVEIFFASILFAHNLSVEWSENYQDSRPYSILIKILIPSSPNRRDGNVRMITSR
jgi:hypothetical protein